MRNSDPPLTIVGTGAMACLFGARLAPYAEVTMLGTWKAGLRALEDHGVRLREPDGSERVFPVRTASDPAQCANTRLALVLVKSWQTPGAAHRLARCMAPDGVALTLQNGLGNRERLEQALGEERVALGVTTSGATLLGPGLARPGGMGPVHLGSHPRLPSLVDLLRTAGMQVSTGENIESLLWGKLVINSGINPLTALLGVPNGALLELPHIKDLMTATAEETASVASAGGITLPYVDPAAAIAEVARQTASNHSSMLQDIRRGAPTEIDAINGAVVCEGERRSLPTPVNRTLWHLVRGLVSASSRGPR